MIVDSHAHIASPDRDRYPVRPGGVGSGWYRSGDVGAPDLLARMDRHGVDRTVVVQAVGAYGYDCSYAVDAVQTVGDRLSLVGAVDMDGPDPVADLRQLSLMAGQVLRGVRVFGVFGHEPVWLRNGRADAVFSAAADLGITVVPTLFAHVLTDLAAVARRHPTVPVALDHCGFPDYADDSGLRSLVDIPSVHLKVTTHVLQTGPDDLVDLLAAEFGADRLCWGSDFPQTLDLDYGGMLERARHACSRLTPEAQAAFLGGTAAKLW